MKAVLDHVGIAVADLPAALAFFRDALGLDVEAPEDVPSEHVRAHRVPVGGPCLELLEATADESPIARFVARHGAGLHHITLRVDDIHAALAQLRARRLRLVDEQPRPGVEGALIAFVHPSSAHGVLVELTQARPWSPAPAPRPAVQRFAFGDLELVSLHAGFFRLDGGAMFGVVPKPLWERKLPADERNRVRLTMRPLLVRGARTILIDAGVGDKEDEKFTEIYGLERACTLETMMAEAGVAPEDVDLVVATHLHFDHAGGFTVRDATGRPRPRFPRARYVVRRGEWEDATHPHERNRASYLGHNFLPLAEAGVLQLVDDDQFIMPGVRVRRTGGHTMYHQMIDIESGGRSAAYVADLIPTIAHLPAPWVMGFDLYPVDVLTFRKAFLRDAVLRQVLLFFAHDPACAAAYVRDEQGAIVAVPADVTQ